jgi:hypothetical protein
MTQNLAGLLRRSCSRSVPESQEGPECQKSRSQKSRRKIWNSTKAAAGQASAFIARVLKTEAGAQEIHRDRVSHGGVT